MENTDYKGVIYEFEGCVLDPNERTLTVDGVPIHLPAKEFDTLLYLVENNGRANQRIDDKKVLARANKLARIVLTNNRLDFKRLHHAGHEHAGMILCTFDIDFVRQAGRIHQSSEGVNEMANHLIHVNRPS